jgi:bifunctional non-homologous end joining protein LigD
MGEVIELRRRLAPARTKLVAAVFPTGLLPWCLAENRGRAPAGARWVHEIKHDGFRSQAHRRAGEVRIFSKGGHDWTDRYRRIADEIAGLRAGDLVLDGEMAVVRADGTCDFWALQEDARAGRSDRLHYFIFDILCHDGADVRHLPLWERKERLRAILGKRSAGSRLHLVDYVEGDGPKVWATAHALNVEGIVSKPLDSPYRSGLVEWVKTPCAYRENLVIAGMAFDGDKFEGLYMARRNGAGLDYAGRLDAEHGIPEALREPLRTRLAGLVAKKQPVETGLPKKGARWLLPDLEAQIVHRGGIGVQRMRRPIFERIVEPVAPALKPAAAPALRPPRAKNPNIQRLLENAEVPTREQLRAHWKKFGKKALEHIGQRPLTLVRHVDGETFFHMGTLPDTPEPVHRLDIVKADGKPGVRLWLDSVQGLLDLVDIGVVEVHPWPATVDDIERPDHLIFDLDPGPGIEWPFVRETALVIRELLEREGYECWPKLTGGSGLHIMAPIEPELSHKDVHAYAFDLARQVAARAPDRYTIEAGPARRIGKLFIDHLRNGRGFTAVGAYSPSGRKGLPIASPSTWEAVKAGTVATARMNKAT